MLHCRELILVGLLTSFLQAVVAASTQGEDRKEAPSDDLTPGSINSNCGFWSLNLVLENNINAYLPDSIW